MKFRELEKSIHHKLEPVSDHFSVYIETDEGTISINPAQLRCAASLAKLPILIAGFRQLDKNPHLQDKLVYIKRENMVGGAGVINYLSHSHIYSYRNLLELMIIVSDNTAANVLLDILGVETINQLTKDADCQQSIIQRKFMDLQAKENGLDNYTSAYDIAKLLHLISENNKFLTKESQKMILTILANQQFTNKLPSYLQAEDEIQFYHKTGELQGVTHDAGIMKYQDKTIHVVLLSEGISLNAESERIIADIGHLLIRYIK
ncbi:serine hydrolase [Agaribacter marinus]|uniref:Serine hydrolase n=1 Tax=Virgibacillus salarius TaxID=447199 RepID=A0A941IAX8_9BACI|nr:serine hydrolase [Virgibacillus salarius]MBR7797133.1 serine hydrolase [Virgibacillus salarius]NAZ09842.1 serine hydrolase [Agaribacter marinus]